MTGVVHRSKKGCVGASDGAPLDGVGVLVGGMLGMVVGKVLDGDQLGPGVGARVFDGLVLGVVDGTVVGIAVVGLSVGMLVGRSVNDGLPVGIADGVTVNPLQRNGFPDSTRSMAVLMCATSR